MNCGGSIWLALLSILLTASVQGTLNCPFTNDTGTIDLSGLSITNVTYDTFTVHYNCSPYFGDVQTLNMSHNSITTVDANSFTGLYSLVTLDLSHNSIYQFDNDTFKSLGGVLEYIYLGYNNFTTLTAGPYNLFKLREIHFEHNNVSYLEPGVVNNDNNRLMLFNLVHNQLTTFEPWPYLVTYTAHRYTDRIFDLQYNQITHLTNNMNWTHNLSFPFEVYVRLQYNKLESLSIDDLRQYKQDLDLDSGYAFFLTFYMNISNNGHVCDCNLFYVANNIRGTILRWNRVDEYRYRCGTPSEFVGIDWLHDLPLYNLVCNRTNNCPANCTCQDRPHNDTLHIDCTGAGLTEFPDVIPDTERTKVEMFLGDNNITNLKNTSYLHKLYNLTMPNNKLNVLDENVLKEMSNLTFMDIRNNQIRIIPDYVQKFQFDDFKISGNPLYCECGSQWMADWVGVGSGADAQNLECDTMEGVKRIRELVENDVCEVTASEVIIIVGVLGGVTVVVILATSLFVYRCPYETKVIIKKIFRIHPWDKYKVDSDESKDIDLYLIFDDHPDIIGYVRRLVKSLHKKKPHYNIFNPYAYAEAGANEQNVRKYIGKSKRVLVILSESIFENEWIDYEIKVAEDNLVTALAANEPADATKETVPENTSVDDITEEDMKTINTPPAPSQESVAGDNFDNVKEAGKIIYIKYNDEFEEKLTEDPWKKRLLGKKVLTVGERMFMSKLRYELPPNGSGDPDDEFFRIAPPREDIVKIKQNRRKHGKYFEVDETVPDVGLAQKLVNTLTNRQYGANGGSHGTQPRYTVFNSDPKPGQEKKRDNNDSGFASSSDSNSQTSVPIDDTVTIQLDEAEFAKEINNDKSSLRNPTKPVGARTNQLTSHSVQLSGSVASSLVSVRSMDMFESDCNRGSSSGTSVESVSKFSKHLQPVEK